MGAIYGSLDRDDDVLAIGINRAVDLIARKMASVRNVGVHPGDKEPISVRKGRFGPYVQHGKTVANLPRGVMMEDVTVEQAVALLAEKGKQLRPRGAAGRRGRAGGSGEASGARGRSADSTGPCAGQAQSGAGEAAGSHAEGQARRTEGAGKARDCSEGTRGQEKVRGAFRQGSSAEAISALTRRFCRPAQNRFQAIFAGLDKSGLVTREYCGCIGGRGVLP